MSNIRVERIKMKTFVLFSFSLIFSFVSLSFSLAPNLSFNGTYTPDMVCSTYLLSVSSITDCVGSSCKVDFSNLIDIDLSHNIGSCIKFKAINDSLTIPEFVVEIRAISVGYNIPLDFLYFSDDPELKYYSYCTCYPTSEKNDCDDMSSYSGDVSFCLLSSGLSRNCLISKHRTYARTVTLDGSNRYMIFRKKTPVRIIDISVTNNGFQSGLEWDGKTPSYLDIGSNLKVDLLSSNIDDLKIIPSYAIVDKFTPGNIFFSDDVNGLGSHDPNKLGFFQKAALDEKFSVDIDLLKNNFHGDTIKCSGSNTQTSLSLNYKNFKQSIKSNVDEKQDLMSLYPQSRVFSPGNIQFNLDFEQNTGLETRVVPNINSESEFSKWSRYYELVDSADVPVTIGKQNNFVWYSYSEYMQPQILRGSIELRLCNETSLLIYSNEHNVYMDSEFTIILPELEFTGKYDCVLAKINDPPVVKDNINETYHIYAPTPKGTIQVRILGSFSGISFSQQACPKIKSVSDNFSNHTITVVVYSTCGNGPALFVVEDSKIASNSIALTSTPQSFIFDRIQNFSGNVLIKICSRDKCDTKTIKLSYFSSFEDIDLDTETEAEEGKSESSLDSDFVESINQAFSKIFDGIKNFFGTWSFKNWKETLATVVKIIIFIILGIISLVLIYFLGRFLFRINILSKLRKLSAMRYYKKAEVELKAAKTSSEQKKEK